MLWGVCICAVVAAVASAQVTLTGRIIDEHEAPIGGARVSVSGPQPPAVEANAGPAGTSATASAAPTP